MIGFVESEYHGEERGEDHSVLAGYISGLPDNRIIAYTPTSITASELILSVKRVIHVLCTD